MSEHEKVDLAALQAQLELDHASLADRVLSRLGSSGTSSSSSPSSILAPRRPAKLGLGAPIPASATASTASRIADSRLKGRLTKKQKRGADEDEPTANGARHDVDDDDDNEDSRAAMISARNKDKGKVSMKPGTIDPFSAPLKKQKQKQLQQSGHETKMSDGLHNAKVSLPIATQASDTKSVPVIGDGSEKLSKSQRKKLAKQKRKLEEEGAVANSTISDNGMPNCVPDPHNKRTKVSHISGDKSNSLDKKEVLAVAIPPAKPPAAALQGTLTAHQTALSLSLAGAHFRTLNESLYTTPSSTALSMVRSEPALLESYHAGFRAQVRKWPQRPVDVVASILRGASEDAVSSKGQVKDAYAEGKKKKKKIHALSKTIRISSAPLVADLGCGEAPLAKLFEQDSQPGEHSTGSPAVFRPRVLNYDLLTSPDGWVQGCDVAARGGVPLPGRLAEAGRRARLVHAIDQPANDGVDAAGSKGHIKADHEDTGGAVVEAVVFCLSLMGTNWVEMIVEARRILVVGGALIIAEVSSRFTSHDDFIKIILHLGFKLGDVDDSNTHFVVMTFTKQTLGELKGEEEAELVQWTRKGASLEEAARLDDEEEQEAVERGKEVLKPCLYKRR